MVHRSHDRLADLPRLLFRFSSAVFISIAMDPVVVPTNCALWTGDDTERRQYCEVQFVEKQKKFLPGKVSSVVLTRMKETAEAYLGSKVDDAVVTLSVDRTPTRTTHLCTCSSRNAVHKYSHSPREHVWLKGQHSSRIAHCSVSETTCHPSVMSHMMPHLPQNTSTRSLSPTSPVFRPSSPSLSCPISAHSGLKYETLRDPWRSGGHTSHRL